MDFAPLHIVSGYSFLQSVLTIDKICKNVAKNDYFGASITDKNVLFATPEFVKGMKAINKPYLIGMEIAIEDDSLCLFAINEGGYRHLIKISSLINTSFFDLSLLETQHSGLVGVLITNSGSFYANFVNLDIDKENIEFNKYLNKYTKYCDSFYLGIEVASKEDVYFANKIRNYAFAHQYDCVAFPTIKYEHKEDAIMVDITKAIREKTTLEHKEREGQEYFFTKENYAKIYTTKEIENTVQILKSSKFDFDIKRGQMIHFPVNDSATYLKEQCYQSLKRISKENEQIYIDRLEYELNTIISMGFADYFLIVQDYIAFAKNSNILVGPGRGSAAGSLVSYLLNITTLDPIKYDLKFERFLNPGRKTMPDIDADFMQSRRNEVIDYLKEKYTRDRTVEIITFTTLGPKQALDDVGKVYYKDRPWLSKNLSKTIPDSKCPSLRAAYKTYPAFKELVDSDKFYLDIVKYASKLEGLPRQSSIHPAGIILNDNDIEASLPVCLDASGTKKLSQYEAPVLEEQGYLKMDILSLINLDIINYCCDLVNKNHTDVHLNPNNLDFDIKETYDFISKGYTMGIFQIEHPGMKKTIASVGVENLNDLIQVIALFRPGPMDEISIFAKRKKGLAKISYLSKDLESILSCTYGVIVYQEQVNAIAMKMGGFDLVKADDFRKAISKKKKGLIETLKNDFVKGSLSNGYKLNDINDIFEAISKFSGYGLNKSHAAVYATLAAEMAYLKASYPLEFYASIMEISGGSNTNKLIEYTREMSQRDLKVYNPDINLSTNNFEIVDKGLLFPFRDILDVNIQLGENIVIERDKNGLFTDIFDFVLRMKPYHITEKNIEALIDSGAFDKINNNRVSLRYTIKQAMLYADINFQESTKLSLGEEFATPKPKIANMQDDPVESLIRESKVLGIVLSSNPLDLFKEQLTNKNVTTFDKAKASHGIVNVAGIIKTNKIIKTKKGDPMAFITIYDNNDEMEITLFSDIYSSNVNTIDVGNVILVNGKNNTKNGKQSFIANSLELLEVNK